MTRSAAATTSGMSGHFLSQQIWAGALIASFLLLIFVGLGYLRWRRIRRTPVDDHDTDEPSAEINWGRLSALVGLDNRVSTSRTIALLWTVVVGYCLLALVLIATAKPSTGAPLPKNRIPEDFISTALTPLAPAYLVLLGGPFAAAIAAHAIVKNRTRTGSLQKSINTGRAGPLDVVTDDDGNIDLVDLQYTLFNLVAATFVLTQFIPRPYAIPDIPAAFTTLLGISVSVYATNKAATSNPAKIADTLNPSARPGDLVTVVGQNLAVGTTSPEATHVRLVPMRDPDGADPPQTAEAPVTDVNADAVQFRIPDGLTPGPWNIRIRTNAGGTDLLRDRLTVLPARGIGVDANGH